MADLTSEAVLTTLSKLSPSSIPSPVAALAVLVHAIHIQLGFRLARPSENDSEQPNKLSDDFGQPGRELRLEYKHEQSAMTFDVSVSKVGGRAVVNAIAVEDDKTRTMDIVITDYFSASAFPYNVPSSSDSSSASTMFASANRLKDLISLYKSSVLQYIVPGLVKSSTDDSTDTGVPVATSNAESTERRGRGYYSDPGGPFIGGGNPSPFPVPPVGGGPSRSPFAGGGIPSFGRSDLDPLAGLGGTTDARARLPGGLTGGDGMFMGPDHPLLRDRLRDPNQVQQGPWGGDGYLPPGAVPPGARFDPVGPGFMGPGAGRGAGRGRGGTRWGEPDNDAFRPPRSSDYDHMFG